MFGGLTYGALNGPSWLRKFTAFAISSIDDRYRIITPKGMFTIRTGNPLERWRAETLMEKEPETIRWLDQTISPDSVFYDVGANIGIYTLYAMQLHQTARAVCFEPESLNFARLNQNIVDNDLSSRVLAFPVYLGEGCGLKELLLSRFQAGSALHGSRHTDENTASHRQGISMVSLDSLFEDAKTLPVPTHLKIDVDGPETSVLNGAMKVLTNPSLRHLLVEATADTTEIIERIAAAAGLILKEKGAENLDGTNLIFERA